jgi:hypothetical protein
LQGRYLHIDRNQMNLYALELFVVYGLRMEELLIPLHKEISDAEERYKTRKDQAINEDFKIIQQIALIKLHDFERCVY